MRTILFAILTVCMVSCKDDNANKPGTITGNVANLKNDAAISGARIVTVPNSDTVFTNTEGNFTISDLEPDNYTVIAEKEGFVQGVVPIIVLDNSTSTAFFKLSAVPVVLTGQWSGRIQYYTTDYPLLLNFEKVTIDSIFGSMIIDFTAGADTFPIRSELFFNNDSLHFDLGVTWGMCHAYDMWGLPVNKDSLQGSWRYRCTNDPSYTSPWSAKRKIK
jgi:hypothetical protein